MKTIETKTPFCKSVLRWATLWVVAFEIFPKAISTSIGQTDSVVQFSSGNLGAFENSGSVTVTVTVTASFTPQATLNDAVPARFRGIDRTDRGRPIPEDSRDARRR
jgi:hypothetical protein